MSTVDGPEDAAAEAEADEAVSLNAQPEAVGQKSSSAGRVEDRSANIDVSQSESSSNPRPKKKKRVERPTSISALFQHAYGEATAGRKLVLARDLSDLSVDPEASKEEIDLVRRLAAEDIFLLAPPSLLAGVADLQMNRPVRERVVELILVALVTHTLFEGKIERLVDPRVAPALTGREISDAAKSFTFDTLDEEETVEIRGAKRERLRVNAVTAFELFRVLRDGWTIDQFIDDMGELVWDTPSQPPLRAAALLANAKTATDALSLLSRHFESRLRAATRVIAEARERNEEQARRAEFAGAKIDALTAELRTEQSRVEDLLTQVTNLNTALATEQSRAFVDKSHATDDYEVLRTQIIRQLSAQVNLLTDALHALRNGSTPVAEEFVDRVLSKINGEVKRLKVSEEGKQ